MTSFPRRPLMSLSQRSPLSVSGPSVPLNMLAQSAAIAPGTMRASKNAPITKIIMARLIPSPFRRANDRPSDPTNELFSIRSVPPGQGYRHLPKVVLEGEIPLPRVSGEVLLDLGRARAD